jgi:hypothetical protein
MCLAQRSGNLHGVHPAHMVQEGPMGETLALQVEPVGETVAKHYILL